MICAKNELQQTPFDFRSSTFSSSFPAQSQTGADIVRDSKGRFVKGNPGGPGRPTREYEEKLLIELCKQAADAWPQIMEKVIKDAMRGKSWAVKFLAAYAMGMPQRTVDLTTGGESLNGPQTFDEKVAAIAAALIDRTTQDTEGSVECDLVAPTGETTT